MEDPKIFLKVSKIFLKKMEEIRWKRDPKI